MKNECVSERQVYERNPIFDNVKGIAAYLVVVGHLLSENERAVSVLITACHMPVFFIVSGFFFQYGYKKYSTAEFLNKKIMTLLVPYICWSAVSLFVNGIPLLIHNNIEEFFDELLNIFVYARSVWFLAVMFCTQILCFLLWKWADRLTVSRYVVCVAAWVLMCLVFSGGRGKVLSIYKSAWLFPYFLLGSRFHKKMAGFTQKAPQRSSFFYLAAAFLLYILLIVFVSNREAYQEFYAAFHLTYSHIGYYLVYGLEGCIGAAVIFIAAGLLSGHWQFFEKAGRFSMDIYVVHMFFVKIFKAFCSRGG